MKTINYTGSSKLISRIVNLLNRRAPLPLDGNGDPDWGTVGQVLTTDGSGSTSWGAGGGGGDSVSWTQTQLSGDKIAEIDINGTTTNVYAPSQTPQAQADWTEADNTQADYIKNKPNLATVATSGSYTDLTDKPTIPTATSDLQNDSGFITGVDVEDIGDVDLTSLADGQILKYDSVSQKWKNANESGGGGTYTEGDGIDISAQDVISVDTTFTDASTRTNIASGDAFATILGKIKKFFADLKTVAFTGSYTDLSNQPTIPTNTNQLTNGAGFITTDDFCRGLNYYGTTDGKVSAYQSNISYQGSDSNWASYLIFNHGDGATYYHQMIRVPFSEGYVPQYQKMVNGTLKGWKDFITDENIATKHIAQMNGARKESTLYATNDTHMLRLCTITLGQYNEYVSLLVTSSFWGDQHGSADIINIQASPASNMSKTNVTVQRTHLAGNGGNGDWREFYYVKSGNTLRLYVYVTGGNSYGSWNVSPLRLVNASIEYDFSFNVQSSETTRDTAGKISAPQNRIVTVTKTVTSKNTQSFDTVSVSGHVVSVMACACDSADNGNFSLSAYVSIASTIPSIPSTVTIYYKDSSLSSGATRSRNIMVWAMVDY